jgi:glycosyltransferase involved in cell wall biosynthesis
MPELSLIVPVMNESKNIHFVTKRIKEALNGIDYEIIWVDDGSTDDTSAQILANANESTRLICFSRNYGQSSAMQAGIDHARGNYIAFIDGDGQNDPADIPRMLKILASSGADMVAGVRKNRKDNFLSRKLPSQVANFIIRRYTGVPASDLGCTLKVLRKDLAKQLCLGNGMHRFIPILAKKAGGHIVEIPVQHQKRINGKSKYGLSRVFRVIKDLQKLRNDQLIEKPVYQISMYYPDKSYSGRIA